MVERDRAMRILSIYYPSRTLLDVQIASGAILPIHFGGFEALFCSLEAVLEAGLLRQQQPALSRLRRAA